MSVQPTKTETSGAIPILKLQNGTIAVPTYDISAANPIIGIRCRAAVSKETLNDENPDATGAHSPFKTFNPVQAVILEFTPASLETVDYVRLISKIESAVDAQYSFRTGMVVKSIQAVWEDKVMGPSFTRIHEENVGSVVGLVGKGTPWSYLVFEYAPGK
ncbi:MAG: hypothetical protein M1831_006099 [Alyxoria varia]|nr:MAG: hypothetical protein M1831_006099 [Alyxoria varia]